MVESEFEVFFRRHAGMAYGLALSATGDPAAAEDAVQEAFMGMLRQAADLAAGSARTYLARSVLNAASNRRRSEARRRVREEELAAAVRAPVGSAEQAAESAEVRQALRAALAALDEDRRIPVMLHVVEDFSQREVAEVLGLAPTTALRRITSGLEDIRATLVRGGFAALAAPAVIAALRAGAHMPAPAGLLDKLQALPPSAGPAGPGASAHPTATLKGGLIMKMGLGVAAAGLVAGAAFWAAGGSSAESAAAPAAAQTTPSAEAARPRKFATPITDPSAQWEKDKERFAGLGLSGTFSLGELDGTRLETINRTIGRPRLNSGLSTCGRYVYMSYDEKTERYHGATVGAAGYLDGPFSRARFFGDDYIPRQAFREAPSPDGRYVYMVTEKYVDAHLRCLDFVEQTVTTLPAGDAGPINVTVDEQGMVYVVNQKHELLILDPKSGWKPGAPVKLDAQEQLSALSNSLAVDGAHGRLYASSYGVKNWYIWYWDVKDGSFHGVLANPGKGGASRPGGMGGATPGPFDGTRMYGECTVGFGPDDPERRFLYAGSIDDPSLYRLDLEKKWFYKFDSTKGVFIGEGSNRHPEVTYAVMPTWFEDGSFMGTYPVLWRRVK